MRVKSGIYPVFGTSKDVQDDEGFWDTTDPLRRNVANREDCEFIAWFGVGKRRKALIMLGYDILIVPPYKVEGDLPDKTIIEL